MRRCAEGFTRSCDCKIFVLFHEKKISSVYENREIGLRCCRPTCGIFTDLPMNPHRHNWISVVLVVPENVTHSGETKVFMKRQLWSQELEEETVAIDDILITRDLSMNPQAQSNFWRSCGSSVANSVQTTQIVFKLKFSTKRPHLKKYDNKLFFKLRALYYTDFYGKIID